MFNDIARKQGDCWQDDRVQVIQHDLVRLVSISICWDLQRESIKIIIRIIIKDINTKKKNTNLCHSFHQCFAQIDKVWIREFVKKRTQIAFHTLHLNANLQRSRSDQANKHTQPININRFLRDQLQSQSNSLNVLSHIVVHMYRFIWILYDVHRT